MRLMTIAQSGANSDAGYISVNIRSTQFKKVRFEYIVMLFVTVSCCTLLTWPRCYSVCNSFSQVNQLFFSNIDDCMPKIAMWYVDIRCRYIGLDLSDADYDVLVVTSLGIYSFNQRIQEWRLSKCKSYLHHFLRTCCEYIFSTVSGAWALRHWRLCCHPWWQNVHDSSPPS